MATTQEKDCLLLHLVVALDLNYFETSQSLTKELIDEMERTAEFQGSVAEYEQLLESFALAIRRLVHSN